MTTCCAYAANANATPTPGHYARCPTCGLCLTGAGYNGLTPAQAAHVAPQLAAQGLVLAAGYQAGWYCKATLPCGTTRTLWCTNA